MVTSLLLNLGSANKRLSASPLLVGDSLSLLTKTMKHRVVPNFGLDFPPYAFLCILPAPGEPPPCRSRMKPEPREFRRTVSFFFHRQRKHKAGHVLWYRTPEGGRSI